MSGVLFFCGLGDQGVGHKGRSNGNISLMMRVCVSVTWVLHRELLRVMTHLLVTWAASQAIMKRNYMILVL